MSALVIALAVLAVGGWASDAVRVRQEEVILHKLAVADAHAFYAALRSRVRRARLLRGLTLLAALAIVYSLRHRPPPPRGRVPGPSAVSPSLRDNPDPGYRAAASPPTSLTKESR